MDFNQDNQMVPLQIEYQQQQYQQQLQQQQQQQQQNKSRISMKRTYSSMSFTSTTSSSPAELSNNNGNDNDDKFSSNNALMQEEPDHVNRSIMQLPHHQQYHAQQQLQQQQQSQQYQQQQQQKEMQTNHFPSQQMPNFESESVTANMIDLFDGAIYVVSQQLDKTIRESSCAVCHRPFDNPAALKFATDTFISSQNTLKMRRTMLVSSMGGGNYQSPEGNGTTTNTNNSNNNNSGPTSARRLGYQTYLRQIKHDCLRDKECVVCHRSFDHAQSMMPLLSHIDKLLDSCSSRFTAEPSW